MALKDNIFAWRDTPLQATELPGLIYRDRTETKDFLTFGRNYRRLTLEIEVFGSTADEIREAIADIETVIYNDETWGGLALNTQLNTNEMEIDQKENYFAASRIYMIVNFTTVKNDPYTQ